MFIKNLDSQILCLAALYQSCNLISRIAWEGSYNEEEFTPLINSIMNIESETPQEIYGSMKALEPGLRFMKKQIVDDIFTRSSETRRYISSIKNLIKKLDKETSIINKFQNELISLNNQENIFPSFDDKVIEIGNIYQRTFSKIDPRIVISGDNSFLKNELNAARIRSALMAAIRSIYLWKQSGGSDIKLFIFKSTYVSRLKEINATMQN